MEALVKEAREAKGALNLDDNNLGALSKEALQALFGALASSTSITTLYLRYNNLGKKHAAAIAAALLTAARLRKCEMDDELQRAIETLPGLAPFAHPLAAWNPGVMLGPRAFVTKLLCLGLCALAVWLPFLFAETSPLPAPPATASDEALSFTFDALAEQCATVPAALEHAYIDATTGFVVVVASM